MKVVELDSLSRTCVESDVDRISMSHHNNDYSAFNRELNHVLGCAAILSFSAMFGHRVVCVCTFIFAIKFRMGRNDS